MSSHRVHRVVAGVVMALALVWSTAPAAGAATPSHRPQPRPTYLALGDSYAAGLGAGEPKDACGRTSWGYPTLLAKLARLELTLAACSGATMADVAGTQLAAVTDAADYVTVQVGGNDIGFVPVLSVCAQPDSDTACAGALAQSNGYLSGGFSTAATALFAAVRARAPRAELVVVGYPRLFSGTNCSAAVEFSAGEEKLLNKTISVLNDRLAAAAHNAGAEFANPESAFNGHAWCSRLPWVNGPIEPVIASFHPNLLGQALGYVPAVGRKLLG